MINKILIVFFVFFCGIFYGQNKDSLVDKNKESIALLKQKIANLENGISPEVKNEVLEKEIIVFRDSIVYLTRELENCAAEKEQTQTELKSISKEGKVGNIYFSSDIYKLSKENEKNLDAFVAKLPSSYLFIVIKGHADSTGEKNLNETISRKRANAIKEYLILEKNISPEKIMINWFGSDKPNLMGDNKRCEVSVI